MEDYNSNLLNDSKNEWSIRLMNTLSGHVIDGFRSIFNESIELCEKNEEPEKYLMTFQNFLSRIPKWNQNMIEVECKRIKETSKCEFLEDLITCVHIIQLKILSCVRTSNQSQKIDIDIPSFDAFLHNVYINIARKLYSNIYLFQVDVSPLEQQKNTREFEIIVQTSIMNTIRDNIPIDKLLKQYMDETQMEDVEEKVISKEVINEEKSVELSDNVVKENSENENVETFDNNLPNNISFNQNVEKYDPVNNEKETQGINFEPKEEIQSMYEDEDEDNYDDNEKITIGETLNMKFGEENTDTQPPSSEELTSIDLNELPIENEEPQIKNDIIDLNIEEIKL